MHINFDLQRNIHNFLDLNELHCHDELEILICFSEGGHFIFENGTYPLNKGMVFIIEKSILHRCSVEVASYSRYIMHIDYDALRQLSTTDLDILSQLQQVGNYVLFNDDQLSEIKILMDKYLSIPNDLFSELSRNITIMEIIRYILQHSYSSSNKLVATSSTDFTKIIPVLNYIRVNYKNNISLDEVSTHCYISKYYLCRLFKSTTGMSIGNYIINYRIRQACKILRQKVSVQEVGEAVGFTNNANFIRTFKHIIGVTPGNYKKKYTSSSTTSKD